MVRLSCLPMLSIGLPLLLQGVGCKGSQDSSDWVSPETSDQISSVFDYNNVMSDEFFRAVDAVDADGLQYFFEESPYSTRSWLADAQIDGQRASNFIVDTSRAQGINPLVMAARMQTEGSLIAATKIPIKDKVDFSFGCGCYDNEPCLERYRGLDKQISCAADTLNSGFVSSQQGLRRWRKGQASTTGDLVTVTPQTHATASLYAYTPWVLPEEGGNWLVWNVASRFEQHAKKLKILAGDPSTPLVATWDRLGDGSYDLSATPAFDVETVRYFVDGIEIGEAQRSAGESFYAHRVFNVQGSDRPFQVRAYNQVGTWVSTGNGRIDVTQGEAVFVRQTGVGAYEVGLERPASDAGAIRVWMNEVHLAVLSSQFSFFTDQSAPGWTTFKIDVLDASSAPLPLRSYTRSLMVK